jgi:Helix-turn-helix of insertion element transposase
MANKSRKEQLKARLTAAQQKAAYMLVENELLPTGDAMTLEEIAKECGVERMTLYRWRTRNEDFIEFKNLIADDFLSTDRERVYGVLMKMIFGKQPSVKALDLYFKRFGLLNDKLTVEQTGNDYSAPVTAQDVAERLKQLGIDVGDGN